MSTLPRAIIAVNYAEAAQDYLRELRVHHPEHFMEATAQGTQRKVTLASFDLVHVQRPDVQIFNELLVQYPREGQKRPAQVVPDNMVVIHPELIEADGSFDTPLQPARPFMMLEYVSKHSKRKDYDDNFDRYEKELKVPYYLVFYPENQELTLYRLEGQRYATGLPNEHGRYPIPELEMEVAILDGWLRFWFREKLLPLPGDLLRSLEEMTLELRATSQQLEKTSQQLEKTSQQLEKTSQQLEKTSQQLEKTSQQLDEERQARLALEQELERLRSETSKKKKKS